MKHSSTDSLSYTLLSAANPPPEFAKLHNDAFNFWFNLWDQEFEKLKIDPSHLREDFVRQSFVSCLSNGESIVAVFLHAFASIETHATREHRYMKENFPELFFEKIKRRGVHNVMTSNYLAVHPEWRKDSLQIRVAPVMVGLSLRVRDLFGADGFIGVWRNDKKVNQLSYDQGGECIIADVQNHNVLCDLILMDSRTPYQYPNVHVEQQVNTLWKMRTDAFFKPNFEQERKIA
jgi:hypothetical protein